MSEAIGKARINPVAQTLVKDRRREEGDKTVMMVSKTRGPNHFTDTLSMARATGGGTVAEASFF